MSQHNLCINQFLDLNLMGSVRDPRLLELKRLQLALDAASRHLDEFEARLLSRSPKARVRTRSSNTENSIAGHIAVGLAKLRQRP